MAALDNAGRDEDPALIADQPEADQPADGNGAGEEALAEMSAPDGDEAAQVLLGELAGRLGKVEEQLADFHRRSAHRESVIDSLHEENQRLRGGIGRIILEPVVADLIRLYDEIEREARRLDTDGRDGTMLRSFADDVAQILDRCGIEIFSAEPGDPFQRGRHRPVGVVPCNEESRHNTVAEVVAAGFYERDTGRVRRPVHARFHQYSPCGGEAGPTPDAAQSL
jgi:molecular chaperone GrpE (heat shock protein)